MFFKDIALTATTEQDVANAASEGNVFALREVARKKWATATDSEKIEMLAGIIEGIL